MNSAVFMYTLNNALGKDAMSRNEGFATFNEFTFVRMWFMAIAAYVCLLRNKQKVTDFRPDLRWILIARCAVGAINFLLIAIALKNLPISVSVIIMGTSPFTTALLQYWWVGQKITVYDGISMVGAFSGVVLIGLSAPKKLEEANVQPGNFLLGITASVSSAIVVSFIFVATSRMKSIHYMLISFYLGIIAGLMCTVGMFVQYVIDGRIPF